MTELLTLAAVAESQGRLAPVGVQPTTIILVRRPEETSLTPPYAGKPIDLLALTKQAHKAGYSEKRSDDTLYLFSQAVLPVDLWREEARVRQRLLSGVGADGTLTVSATSEEGRYILGRIGTSENYEGDVNLQVAPTIRLTLERDGKAADFTMNAPLRKRKAVPRTLPSERSGPLPTPRAFATDLAMRGDYAFEESGRTAFYADATISRRKIAFGLIEEESKGFLDMATEDQRRMFAAWAPIAFDEKRIPARGTSYASLNPEVRDEIAYEIRNNPKRYGFADEGDASKWLSGANVKGAKAWVGLGIETSRGASAAMLARLRY